MTIPVWIYYSIGGVIDQDYHVNDYVAFYQAVDRVRLSGLLLRG